MSEHEIQQRIRFNKQKDGVKDAMKEVINNMNIMGGDEAFAQGIFEALVETHRTLQQDFIRAFVLAMKSYSESPTDLRNEQSVAFAKKVNEIDSFFPNV